MAKIESGGGGSNPVDNGGSANQADSNKGFSDAAKGAFKSAAEETGAFDDKKLTGEEVSGLRDKVGETNPELSKELDGMSDDKLKSELEKTFADQLGGSEEKKDASKAEEKKGAEKPEEKKDAEKAGDKKGGGGGGGSEKAGDKGGNPLDINKDGKVDEKDMQELLKKFDKNGDGKLDEKEMGAAAKELGVKPEELKKLMDKGGEKGGESSGAEGGGEKGADALAGADSISDLMSEK
jgi:hypothetical protein